MVSGDSLRGKSVVNYHLCCSMDDRLEKDASWFRDAHWDAGGLTKIY